MLTAAQFEAITGDSAPEGFDETRDRVLSRLSALLNRNLRVDFSTGLPADLQDAVAWGVHSMVNPEPSHGLLQGATSLSIAGEYSVSVAAGTVLGRDGYAVPARYAFAADLGGRCLSQALRYRQIPIGF